MALEIIGLSEGLTTLVTLERAYTSVDQLMPGECIPVCEGLSASSALEGLLLAVCPHVGQQRWLQGKCTPTDLARIWLHSCVCTAMGLKTSLLWEGTTTEVTFVWFLSSVNQLMTLQVFKQSELLAALCAFMLFHSSVNELMALQSVVANECLPTFITFELLQLLILLTSIFFCNFDLGNWSSWTNRLRDKNAPLLSWFLKGKIRLVTHLLWSMCYSLQA